MKKALPSILWTLFSAGGTISAFIFPVHIFLLGLAFPLGWFEAPGYESLAGLIRLPSVRLYLLVIISLPLFHTAHRLRYTLYDGLKLKHLEVIIVTVCYGTAILLSIAAAITIISFN